MTEFDTSGSVADVPGPGETARSVAIRDGKTIWSDLSPFTQGYVEALLTPDPHRLPGLSWRPGCPQCVASKFTCDTHYRQGVGFSDLAPETLARIIADCERRVSAEGIRWATVEAGNTSGHAFWRLQQDGDAPSFPPLTVQLGDDGKVRFA